MSEIGAINDSHPAGTLLWIGDRHSAEFQEPFHYCESHVAQLALRSDLADAIRRPAAAVRRILITRATRQPSDEAARSELSRWYPNASAIELLGTLCEGERAGPLDRSESPTHYWHEWNQFLPQWLRPCTHFRGLHMRDPKRGSARSVAVVASSASVADPLMELATSAGVAVTWCRRPDLFRARNFDAVWWDDSVAKPTTARRWRERLSKANSRLGIHPSFGSHQQHAWIVQSPRIDSYRQAKAGGVDFILSKPGQIDCLSEKLANTDASQRATPESDRRSHAA